MRRRRAVHHDLGAPSQSILSVVGEGHALGVHLRGSRCSHRLVLVAADIEHVTEVGLHPERALDVDRLAAAVLDADPLVQPAVDEAAATNAQALLWNPALAFVQKQHRVDHLKGGHVAFVDGGREEDWLQPVQPKLIP